MGLLDTIKGMFGGKKAAAPSTTEQMGELMNDVQDVARGNIAKAGEVLQDVKDMAASVDIPGTDIDDKLKETLGVGKDQK
ncbi:hypothetical protein KBD87_01155 [Candidatus Saccharibacteria bacterium]|nr:hypothetical protein [Candidatus Saccharibacteria bacterium]